MPPIAKTTTGVAVNAAVVVANVAAQASAPAGASVGVVVAMAAADAPKAPAGVTNAPSRRRPRIGALVLSASPAASDREPRRGLIVVAAVGVVLSRVATVVTVALSRVATVVTVGLNRVATVVTVALSRVVIARAVPSVLRVAGARIVKIAVPRPHRRRVTNSDWSRRTGAPKWIRASAIRTKNCGPCRHPEKVVRTRMVAGADAVVAADAAEAWDAVPELEREPS